MAYKKIIISDFAGGITDKPEDGNINKAYKLDNVNLRDNGKLETRPGSWVCSDLAYRTINKKDAKLVLQYEDDNIYIANGKAYLENTSTFSELQGVNTAIEIFPEADNDTFYSSFKWKNQFVVTSNEISRPVKFFKDDTRGWQVVSVGLPALASTPTVTVSGGAGSFSYIAGFCHKYSYNINDVEYIVRGPIALAEFTGATGGVFQYGSIPVLTNGSDTHYDLVNTDIEIYRTLQSGNILYLDKTIDIGTTSTTSTQTDAQIEANIRAYTDGGVLDNDPPPKCKYVMQSQNYAYYLGVTGDISKGLEAKADSIDAVPASASFKLDMEISGGGIIFDDFLAFTKKKWYILNGHYDDKGGGSVKPKIISNTEGVLYHTSFINCTYGAIAFGTNSFLFCNGAKVTPLSDFDELYRDLVANSSETNPVVAAFDTVSKRVYFSCKTKSQSEYNDTIYAFHEKLWDGKYGAFTTWSGNKYFNPRYIQWLTDNTLFRGEAGGWLLKHDRSYKYDPIYKDSTLVSSWNKQAVKEDIITSYLYGDDSSIRKWGVKMLMRCLNVTNLSIQPSCATDGSSDFKPMSKLDVRYQMTWGEEHIYWDQTPNLYWKDTKDIQRMVRMPSGFARFTSRQLRFQRAFSIIYRPEQGYAATVTVDAGAKTVLFNGSVPSNILEKYILVNEYSNRHLILLQLSSNAFKVSDPDNVLVSGTYKWIIKGYPINQIFSPIEFIMYYVDYGESQSTENPVGVVATK